MNRDYDLIVIGAGNGGLAAALNACSNGMKTLVVEKHNLPGGSASSLVRGRFEFESSLHVLAGVGGNYEGQHSGKTRKMWEKYGIDEWLAPVDELFTMLWVGQGVEPFKAAMPAGREAFIEELERQSPGSEESMRKFFELADECLPAYDYIFSHIGNIDRDYLKENFPTYVKLAGMSLEDVFKAINMPYKASLIVKANWSYICIPTDEFEFPHYAAMVLDDYIDNKPSIPEHRSYGMSAAIEQRIRDFGGEFWYNTPVDEILVENNAAYGIRVGDTVVTADQIISNISPDIVYSKLINREHVPEKALQISNMRTLGVSNVAVYCGLNKTAEELGFKEYETFVYPADSRACYDMISNYAPEFDPINIGYVYVCPNVVIPDYSPEGTCILWGSALMQVGAFDNVKPEEYYEIKEQMMEGFVNYVKMTSGIDISDSIEEIDAATPATLARYLSTPNGSCYGYQGSMWDSMSARALTYKEESFIDNLLFCGGHTYKLDGMNMAYDTGIEVSDLAVKKFNEKKSFSKGGR